MLTTNRAISTRSATRALASSSILYRTALVTGLALATGTSAFADGTGFVSVSGGSTVSTPSSNLTVVTSTIDKSINSWESFGVQSGETVRFNQPGSGSVSLNRVRGGNPSEILGNLSSNGKLILVNPNGVFFGLGSRVDVAGLVATTADISNSNFNAGKMIFDKAGNPNASIVNKGTITATDGGLVALVAPGVRNDGVIQANLGTVALASGSTATIDMYGDNLYSFALGKTATAALDENGKKMNSAVENNGAIHASGGTVLLTANAAKDIVTNAINNTGVIEASAAHMVGGTIVLDGGEGNVRVAGTLDVSGKGKGQHGGKVTVTGKNIELAGAKIDASGAAAGGTVRIGGDYQGGGTLAHASTIKADGATTIDVSATDQGNAGSTVLWSDDATDVKAKLLATGGINGGNGGLVEVSSKNDLAYDGYADVHAAAGNAGTLLLDPLNIVIGNVLAAAAEITLNLGGNVVLSTPAVGPQAGNITVNHSITWSGIGSLTLNAINNIIVNADIRSTTNSGSGSRGAITLHADSDHNSNGSVTINNATVSTNKGDILVIGQNVSLLNSIIKSVTGDIFLNNDGVFFSDTAGSISNGGDGNVTVRQAPGGSIQNAVNAIASTGTGGGEVHLDSGTWYEQVKIKLSNFILRGNGTSTVIKAPNNVRQLLEYTTIDGFKITPIIYVDGLNNVSILSLSTDGSNRSNVGIAYNNAANGTLALNHVTNSAGDGILLDRTNDVWAWGNTISNSASLPSQEMGSGIHLLYSQNAVIGGDLPFNQNVITNSGWDGIKITGAENAKVTNNAIDGAGRVGIYGSAVYNSTFSNNVIKNTGNVTAFAGMSFENDTTNLTLTDNTISGSHNGSSGMLLNGLKGTKNLVSGNVISDTGLNGITVLNSPGIAIANNFIGFTDKIGTSGGANNIQGDGIFVTTSDNAVIKGNHITDTKSIASGVIPSISGPDGEMPLGSGIHVTKSNGVTIGGGSLAEGNTITNAGWDGIKLERDNNTTVASNSIDATGRVGIYGLYVNGLQILKNTINNTMNQASGFGAISIDKLASNLTIFENTITNVANDSDGILINTESGTNTIIGNTITGATRHGIQALDTSNLTVSGNVINGTGADGIHLSGDTGVSVESNIVGNTGLNGINVLNSAGASILDNYVGYVVGEGSTVVPGVADNIQGDGISVTSSNNAIIAGNFITNTKSLPSEAPLGSGIHVMTSNGVTIGGDGEGAGNTITNAGWDGIKLERDNDTTVANNYIDTTGRVGIYGLFVNGLEIAKNTIVNTMNNASGFAAISIDKLASNLNIHENTIKGVANNSDGILINTESGTNSITNNSIAGVTRDGISVINTANVTVAGNKVYNAPGAGIHLAGSDIATLAGNTLDGNSIGIWLEKSNGATMSGDQFLTNTIGALLDGSSNTQLTDETFAMAIDSGTGLKLVNGSANTTVGNSTFTDGNIAINIDGAGDTESSKSSMQFSDNLSSFTGNNFYFVLQNGAMVGTTLDASQQTFEGTRASDFTEAQLADAEDNHTTDVADDATLGDVFYKLFVSIPPSGPGAAATPFDQSALDEFQTQRRGLYRRGNFSYAGRSFNITTDPIEPMTYDPKSLNLSLLNKANPTAAVDVANLFANLAPAAGGNDAKSLANLAPAAGGPNAQQLASLAPAAGGNVALNGASGNAFLDTGYLTQ